MTEYTPVTEEVVDFVIQRGRAQHPHIPDSETEAAFYRWHRGELARAWDEGVASQAGAYGMTEDAGPNPYRSAP